MFVDPAAAAFPSPICLDLTRLLSRVGAGPWTGIDRVELAWLQGLLRREGPLFALARTATGLSLLDRTGIDQLADRLVGKVPWGEPRGVAQFTWRLPRPRRAAEADLRRLALASSLRGGASGLFQKLPPGTRYLNLGHANLGFGTLEVMRNTGATVSVMVHDTIPLDLPQTQRPGTPARFAERMAEVRRAAHMVIYPSRFACRAAEKHLGAVSSCIAPLAVAQTNPDPGALARIVAPQKTWFLSVGTVDARKNQAILIDAWRVLGPSAPLLILAGRRGWADHRLETALTSLPPNVWHLEGLSDAEIAALMSGATALLHPSRAEGFGLPPLDASIRGVPVIASDLEVFRETLGDVPVYLNPEDRYQWAQAVETHLKSGATTPKNEQTNRHGLMTWGKHIDIVLRHLDGVNRAAASGVAV